MTFKKFSYLVLILFICGKALNAQIENVPIDEPVYNFLKNMSVKGLIGSIRDDNPNLSKDDISDFWERLKVKRMNSAKLIVNCYTDIRFSMIIK